MSYEQLEIGQDPELIELQKKLPKAQHLATGSTGTLWYCVPSKDMKGEQLEKQLAQWITYHEIRTGTKPIMIKVHRDNELALKLENPPLPVQSDQYVLPNHYFLAE